MLATETHQLSELLKKVAETLDIPEYIYQDVVTKYEDVGEWLAEEGSDLQRYSPEIYPQGSFRLGTVIRPVSEKDEYDIDLVCRLTLEKDQVTQERLKAMVGNRLRLRPDLMERLESSRRCWTLNYPKQFHMDVLPTIPNTERPPTGILLTDTELTRWQQSNPIAYSTWFFDQMRTIFQENRAALAKALQVTIDEVPEWQVKTPLQRAVQILKRHRDVYFEHDRENKPVSIIITTLAARAYTNESDLLAAIDKIVRDMPNFIENRNSKWWVPNPVDPGENFADKWNEKPVRREAFFKWIQKAKLDFSGVIRSQDILRAASSLSSTLGQRTVGKAASELGIPIGSSIPTVSVSQATVSALGEIRHCEVPKWISQLIYKASVAGKVYLKSRRKKLWSLTNRPVLKGLSLRFEVQTNTPAPYEVQWQVVNTGQEAAQAGGLRGDFYSSDKGTSNVRWESTLYRGTHWVEAFIIKNGTCVARSDRKYVRIWGI
jgi:hypothetical protein